MNITGIYKIQSIIHRNKDKSMSDEYKEKHRQAALRIGNKPPSRKGIPFPKKGKHYNKITTNTL